MTRRTAAIVGGGVVGLATAIGLHRDGWSVSVHDRGEPGPRLDTAFGLWPDAWAVLADLGVATALAGRVSAPVAAELRRADGVVLARPRRSPEVRMVARTDLLDALAARLPVDVTRHGPVAAGALPAADIVVGADGLHSTVRAALGPARARRLGVVCWRGTLGCAPGFTATGLCETWGGGRMFGVTPGGPGRLNWFAAARAEQAGSGATDPVARLRALYGDWHDGIGAVLARLDGARIDRRDLSDLPRLPTWVGPGLAVAGDAAHAMAPNLGRGCCEGLLDAAALVDHVGRTTDPQAALHAYDRTRRPAADRVRRASRLVNRIATAERGAGLRDAAVGLLGRLA